MRRYRKEDTCIPKTPAECVEYSEFISEHSTLTEDEKECSSVSMTIEDLYKLIDEIKSELPEEGTLQEKLDELATKIEELEQVIPVNGIADISLNDLDTSCMPQTDPCTDTYVTLQDVLQRIITDFYCAAP